MAALDAGRAVRAIRRRAHLPSRRRATATTPATTDVALPPPEERAGSLTPQQVRFFETFGFLVVPGLLADDIDRIEQGFEDVFASNERMETYERLHFESRRMTIPAFVRKSPLLEGLPTDPRVTGIVTSLLGEHFVDVESDGNIFSCETSWHPDTYAAPLADHHVKVSLYLDPLTGENGAVRMMPGTNHWRGSYALALRRELDDPGDIRARFGVDPRDLPGHTIHSVPGDVVVWDFRTVHASFHGGERRRLLSLNFKQLPGPAPTA